MQSIYYYLAEKLRLYGAGIAIITTATLIFFSPYLARIDSYSEGGDAMFNAWLLSRTHHCLLRSNCPNYVDGNIFYPHKDSMLFSETQLSAGLLTLPLHFINPNPIFSYNVWTITQFLLSGLFMYLLASYLSHQHKVVSIVSGLLFEFAPIRISVVSHMQNASIFYLPLIFWLIFNYFDTKKTRYLFGLLITTTLFFYASWYLMVFGLIAMGVLLLLSHLLKLANPKTIGMVSLVVLVSILTTFPLAKEYVRFSRENNARFSISDQVTYSSSVIDYFVPQSGTFLGIVLPAQMKNIHSINPDSISYHGYTLYAVALLLIISVLRRWRRATLQAAVAKRIIILGMLALIGFVISLGPYVKLYDSPYIRLPSGLTFSIPLPYLLIGKLFPQMTFIRAIGRASLLVLFSLCGLMALLPEYLKNIKWQSKHITIAMFCVLCFACMELLPMQLVSMAKGSYAYNLDIPPVYEFIKAQPEIDRILVLHADSDYPEVPWRVAEPEQIMWSGYVNRSIFNGYSGYFPPSHQPDFDSFKTLSSEALNKMKKYKIAYVLMDAELSTSQPEILTKASQRFAKKVYQDKRFTLYEL